MPCILTVSGYGDIRHLRHKDNHFRLSFAGANIAYQGIFQALDHGIASLVLSLIRLLVIPLPAAYLLTLTSSAGKIVWAAVPFGELVGTAAAIVIMGRIKREIKLKD